MIPLTLNTAISAWLRNNIVKNCIIKSSSPLGGGSINEVYLLKTTCGDFFLKYNYADKFPGMFEVELKGLELLTHTKTINVPKAYTAGVSEKYSFLLLEYQYNTSKVFNYWENLGKQLADLHSISKDKFGLDYNNYIGSLIQLNEESEDFIEFLIKQRLLPLIKKAIDKGYMNARDLSHFESLFKKFPELIPCEQPSLIHGDLWSGNVIVNNSGNYCLVDPAIYYGHRESDIAMTLLFGGFPKLFYEVYNHHYPLIEGWNERIELHQLYPLLVHVNLFGSGYASQVRQIISKF